MTNDFELSNVSGEVIKKILFSLDTSKAAGMDQIAEILALPWRNIINLTIKLSAFSEECKIAKLRPIFKKVQGLILETTDLFHFCRQYKK